MRNEAACLKGTGQANKFQEAQRAEEAAAVAVLAAADVIACTCVGAAEHRLEEQAFDVCIVHEASQVTEPDCLIALLKVRGMPI
jgi:regulator of nonsense transcripts 1